jgi:hypothetical protein
MGKSLSTTTLCIGSLGLFAVILFPSQDSRKIEFYTLSAALSKGRQLSCTAPLEKALPPIMFNT